jgi:hypothetical protein
MIASKTFALGDRVQPTSGPYRRTEFLVVGTTGDKIQIESQTLKLSFPPKLLKLAPLRKEKTSNRPKTITVEGVEAPDDAISDRPKLKIGDRVAGIWDETITGIVEAIHPSGRVFVRYSEFVAIEFFESALILVPPEKDLGMDEPKPATSPAISTPENAETIETSLPTLSIDADFKVGDLVTFTQSWWGKDCQFEGEVIAINQPKGTAIVRYRAPDVARELEIQAPIGLFSLSMVKLPPEKPVSPELGGNPLEVAPPGCWIERKVHSGGWVEAVFKARTAIFPAVRGGGMAKSRYIGKWGSPAHSAAIEAVKRRNELEKQKRWSKKC